MTVPVPAIAGKGFYFPPPPPAADQTSFFASRRACVSSGEFSAQDCAEAFAQMQEMLRDRAPKFAEKIDCVVKFRFCEKNGSDFGPAALGVEIVRSRTGWSARPVLAVETSRDPFAAPEAPERDHLAQDNLSDVESWPEAPGAPKPSPYGALSFQALSRASVAPPSLKSYRRFVAEAQIRRALFEQGAQSNRNWRADR